MYERDIESGDLPCLISALHRFERLQVLWGNNEQDKDILKRNND